MANKRTVDPTGTEASSRIVGIRLTATQLQQIAAMCEQRQVSRSELIRQLIHQAWILDQQPEPF